MYRPEGHVEEVLRLPAPFPEQLADPAKAWETVRQVAHIATESANRAQENFILRSSAIQEATAAIEPLVNEYFGVQPLEKLLIADTIDVVIPSIQPTQSRMPVPTVKPSNQHQLETYKKRVCGTLNEWTKSSPYAVRGRMIGSDNIGVGVAILEKVPKAELSQPVAEPENGLLSTLNRLRNAAPNASATLNPYRGLMVFERNRLYIVKPIGQRYWTETAALNDADEIAGTILMNSYAASA
jgi:hypothetical protein